MRERWFLAATRLEVFLVSLGVALIAPPADAALKKYDLARQILLHYTHSSPQANYNTTNSPGSVALIDESGPNPVVTKFILVSTGGAMTTQVPTLTNGTLWAKQESTDGFGANPNTGTGSSTTSINWGNMTGWTISGSFYCHSIPSYICDLIGASDSETTDPPFLSSNYDVGTWTFHGTGFTMNLGWVNRTSPTATGFGNLLYVVRGVRVFDGTVPALPLLAIGVIGVSVFAMGVASMRRGPRS